VNTRFSPPAPARGLRRERVPAPRGFTLVEIVLAVGIITFAFVGIIGLLSVGLAAGRNAIGLVEATHASTLILAELQSPPATNALLPPLRNGTATTHVSELYIAANGTLTTQPNGAAYRVSYRIAQTPLDSHTAASVSLRLSWPPAAGDRGDSLDIVTALNPAR